MGIRRYNIRSGIQLQFNRRDGAYLDTNFLLYCFIDISLIKSVNQGRFNLAKNLFIQLLQKKIPIIISTLVLDEIWFVYLKLLYQKDKGPDTWTTDTLKQHPDIITTYRKELEELQDKIVKHPHLRIIGVPETCVESAFHNMLNFQLAPRDSFHLSVICSEEIKYFITRDRDFSRIPRDCEDIDLKLIKL